MDINYRQAKSFSPLASAVLRRGSLRRCLRVAMAMAVVAGASAVQVAQAAEIPTEPAQSLAVAQASQAERYLFGQVAQPDQIGQGYVVLERSGDRVYGALYYPSSSFDCFSGQMQGSELAMSIYSTYDQEVYGYSLALSEGPAVATTGTSELAPLGLDGFYPIATLSDNDHRMLEVCRTVVTP